MNKLLFFFALGLTFVSCNDANFSQDTKKKGSPRLASDALPGQPTDCTGMSEKDCHDKKADEKSPNSYRNVDCSGKSKTACQDAIDKTKADDGKENSEIRVTNCSASAASLCGK